MIYKDTQLIWAARISSEPPVCVRVAQFGNLPGLITTLDDTGKLSILYLGTDPPTNSVGGADNKELDYEEMDEEHRQLLTVIRESQSDSRVEPKDKIILRAQVPNTTDVVEESDVHNEREDIPNRAYHENGCKIETTLRLHVAYTGSEPIYNVFINLDVPAGFYVREKSITLSSLGGGTPRIIPIKVISITDSCPPSLNVIATAAYLTENNEPRTASLTMRLPLSSACKIVPPIKNANFKVMNIELVFYLDRKSVVF
jgi:Bardet-Biedl syndrome 9 protein